jgi:hypothetical protein
MFPSIDLSGWEILRHNRVAQLKSPSSESPRTSVKCSDDGLAARYAAGCLDKWLSAFLKVLNASQP